MSPDIENGEGFYGEEADIFAAGVVLFILTTGFQPFKSTRPEDPHYRALNASSNRFWQTYKSKKLSEKFRDLIQRMLSEEPDERLSIE
jgi:serine/threonine protein kinase